MNTLEYARFAVKLDKVINDFIRQHEEVTPYLAAGAIHGVAAKLLIDCAVDDFTKDNLADTLDGFKECALKTYDDIYGVKIKKER
jgi:hypothetical protein